MDENTLINYGSAVKALGDGKVGGYLVRFSTPKDTDLEGDFFSKDTDLGVTDDGKLPIYYQHGMDGQLKNKRIGRGIVKFDDIGLWLEAQLEMRDEYEKMIYDLAEQGKLGWSSGAAGHLVTRENVGKSYHIMSWPIAEASLTPTPAEPRNSAVPLKSLLNVNDAQNEAEADNPAQSERAEVKTEVISKENKMEVDELKLQEIIDQASAKSAAAALDEYKKSMPAIDTAGVEVVHDEADNPFKSVAEQCRAIKSAALSQGRKIDPRLNRVNVKATGANEAIPSEGGYLLDPTLSSSLITPIHEEGPFTSKVSRLPVSGNSNYGWINGVDETSRATGSRWGGVRGYRLAEGATFTNSKPKFRRINWELKKYAVLAYATDELLADASQFEAVLRMGAMEELNFMANDDVLNGAGLGGPLGIMNSGALITVTRDTGSKVLHADILAMWQRLHPAMRKNAAWFINSEVEPQLDALYHTTSVLSPYVNYTPEGVLMVKGKPVMVTEFNAALNTTGDILLADMSQYLYWDKVAEAATSIHVAFETDEEAFRFVYRVDGQPALASPITPYKGTNTQGPFVVLGSAT